MVTILDYMNIPESKVEDFIEHIINTLENNGLDFVVQYQWQCDLKITIHGAVSYETIKKMDNHKGSAVLQSVDYI